MRTIRQEIVHQTMLDVVMYLEETYALNDNNIPMDIFDIIDSNMGYLVDAIEEAADEA